MITTITWTSLAMAALLFVAALVDLVQSWTATTNGRAVITKEAEKASTQAAEPGGLTAQSAPDLKDTWEGLAALASAIKDLDRSSRLLVLSLAFLAVAALLASTTTIANALT